MGELTAKQPAFFNDLLVAMREAGVAPGMVTSSRNGDVMVQIGRKQDVKKHGHFCPSITLHFADRTKFTIPGLAAAIKSFQDKLSEAGTTDWDDGSA